MRRWLIEKLGGYTTVYAALESVTETQALELLLEMLREANLPLGVKHRVLNRAIKHLFNTIGPEDILKIHSSGHWLFEGKPLPEAEVKLLQAEAQQFQKSFLWTILQKELKYHGNRKMFTESRAVVDLVAGKLLVYYIDIVATRLKNMMQ